MHPLRYLRPRARAMALEPAALRTRSRSPRRSGEWTTVSVSPRGVSGTVLRPTRSLSTLATIDGLFSAETWLIASNLLSSDIQSLLCACRGLRSAAGLAATKTIPCTSATLAALATTRVAAEKDEALEYVASRELRAHRCYGNVTFDDFCHLEHRSYRKTGYLPPLCDLLAEWECTDVPADHAAQQAVRISEQAAGRVPLTKQGGPPNLLVLSKAVAGRYECNGVLHGKLAALPQMRRAIAERMWHARRLIERGACSDAAPLLQEVLSMMPTHAAAAYQLGLFYLRGAGVAKDKARSLELFDVSGKQGCFDAAFKLGCLRTGRGELPEAQRAFEAALRSDWAMPEQRAGAAYNLGVVHQEQGNVAESESCFLRAQKEGCLRAPYNLGAMYLEVGQMSKAKRFLEEALRGDLVAKACCALGLYYEAHRCPKRARTYYEQALEGGEPLAARCLDDMRRPDGSAQRAL